MENNKVKKDKKQTIRLLVSELKWMYGYVKKYKRFVVIHIIIGIVGTVMSLLGTLASKYLIDAVTGYGNIPIVNAAALMIGMTVGSITSRAICTRIAAKISIKVQNEIQYEVYENIMSAQWEALNEYRSGDLLNRLNSDVSAVSNGVISIASSLVTQVVHFIGAFALIMHYDAVMAVIALLSAPVTIVLSRVLLNKMSTYNHEMRKMSSDIMSFQGESFQNLEAIKSFDVKPKYLDKMNDLQQKYRGTFLDFNAFSIKTTVFMGVVGSIVSFACMGWGVYRLWSGVISFGTMTLFLQLASQLSASFSQLVSIVPSAIGAATSAGRIMPLCNMEKEEYIMQEEAKIVETEAKKSGISINIEDARFNYRGGEDVFRYSSIKACPGEIVAMVGPSGEGKTTLIRLLLGLVDVKEGKAVVASNGKECTIGASTRRLFTYVPQGNTVFPGTIRDNMRLVNEEADDETIKSALETACAYEFVSKMKDGIDALIGEHGTGLSEGQAQRISIARAMMKDAPVLLLDEATSALDMATERRVLKNIMKMDPNKTCIVTTHRPSVLSMCNRVYKVENAYITEVSSEECERMLMDF